MSRALHDLHRSSQSQNANLESKREFPPYFKRSAEMGGAKTRRHTFANALSFKTTQRYKKAGAF
jgi:hypothetical protein